MESKDDYIISNPGIEKIILLKQLPFKKSNLNGPYISSNVELLNKDNLKRLIIEEGLMLKNN